MSKVTRKYQITIPIPVRKALRIVPGGEVDIIAKGKDFVLKANTVKNLKRVWKGKFKGHQSSDEYMAEIRGEMD